MLQEPTTDHERKPEPARCADCAATLWSFDPRDPEPLCRECEALELDERGELLAELNRRPFPVVSVIHDAPPIESHARPRPFGLGFAEIPSSAIVQTFDRDGRDENDDSRFGALGAVRTILRVYALVGLGALVGACWPL